MLFACCRRLAGNDGASGSAELRVKSCAVRASIAHRVTAAAESGLAAAACLHSSRVC